MPVCGCGTIHFGEASLPHRVPVTAVPCCARRFGEASLHHCEVMIRDLADSKRGNANIRQLQLPAPAAAAAAPATPGMGSPARPPRGGGAAGQLAEQRLQAPVQCGVGAGAAAAAAGAELAEQPEGAGEMLEKLHATMASYLFWPELQVSSLPPPPGRYPGPCSPPRPLSVPEWAEA